MPIRPENKGRYPANWTSEIRPRILERAEGRCETCGVPNYAVGYRDAEGRFCPNAGNLHCDASGQGQHPNGEPLTYAEAREFADHYNHGQGHDEDGRRWLVVVLTIAHISEEIEDCSDGNLVAECQACHNRRDMPMRKRNASATLRSRRERGQLVLGGIGGAA